MMIPSFKQHFSAVAFRLSLRFFGDVVPVTFSADLPSLLHGLAGKLLSRYDWARSLCTSILVEDVGGHAKNRFTLSMLERCSVMSPHAWTLQTAQTPSSILGQQVAAPYGAYHMTWACRSYASCALQVASDDDVTGPKRRRKGSRATGYTSCRRKSRPVLKGSRRGVGKKLGRPVATKQLLPKVSDVLGSPGSRPTKPNVVVQGTKCRQGGVVLQAEAADRELTKQLRRVLDQTAWDPSKAQKVILRLKRNLRPLHVCQVLKCEVEVEKALLLFRWAGKEKGYSHSPDVYFEILRILGDAGNFKEAWCILDEIFQQEGTIWEGTLMTLVKSYLKCGMVDEAVHAFYAMDKYGCKPSVSAWNLVLEFVVSTSLQQAFEVFGRMQVAGCVPNSRTYNLLIDCLGREEKVDAAVNLFQEMKMRNCCPDAATYSIMIGLLGRNNKADAAYGIFAEMLEEGCEPNVVVYNTVLDVLGKACKWHLVQTAFKQMSDRGIVPDVWSYSILANCFGKVGKMEEAYKVIRDMRLKGRYPNIVTLNTFLGNLGKMGRIDTSMRLFEQMKLTGHHPCVVTYNTLISMFGKIGKTHRAHELFQEMKARGVVPSIRTYNILLDAFRWSGQQGKVLQLFAEMKENGHVPTVVTYTALVQTFGGTGDFAGALRTLQEMDSQGCAPDEVLFRVLGKCLERKGRWKASSKLYDTLENGGPFQALRELPHILSSACGENQV